MPAHSATLRQIVPREAEGKSLAGVAKSLGTGKPGRAQLIGPDGRRMILPQSLYDVLSDAVRLLAQGSGVSILPVEAELTTRQAAAVLSVSRPHVIKLLEEGRIPFHKVGTHRRVHLADLLAFKRRREMEAQAALDQLVEESQEAGLYDER